MLINYSDLSEEAKVFLYPSSRKFYDNEIEELELQIKEFIANWSDLSLGETTFSASYKIEYNRFILFFISENTIITTALLNKLALFILKLEKEYAITLLDKINVCFKQGRFVQYQEMKRFRKLIKNRSISKKTIVFNNLIKTKYEFENEWEVNVTDSWLSHLFT
ncbi:MAG: ABC transporter ATPase [Flavobacteriaceae bacterium]|nr:ABC transporter ATPase [Flavobacteriaceae bacterium]